MTVYLLPEEAVLFPDPEEAEADGLLAVGGDLTMPRLLAAYGRGIFPWFGQDTPILWWSPDPRLVLFPPEIHIPRSLRRVLNHGPFTVTADRCFENVIRACGQALRPQGPGTWITEDMVQAYATLHRNGFAHSVEVWNGRDLVGGLYGVAIGRVFFGESMFFRQDDASKVALIHLARLLESWEFDLIDCQQTTPHMQRWGAREIPRREFSAIVRRAVVANRPRERWSFPEGFDPLRPSGGDSACL